MANNRVLGASAFALGLLLSACGSGDTPTDAAGGEVAAAVTGELDDDKLSMADIDYAIKSQLALAKAGYTEEMGDEEEDENAPSSSEQSPEEFAAWVKSSPKLSAVFAKADVDPERLHRASSLMAGGALGGEMALSAGKTDGLPQPAEFYLAHRDEIKKRFEELEQLAR